MLATMTRRDIFSCVLLIPLSCSVVGRYGKSFFLQSPPPLSLLRPKKEEGRVKSLSVSWRKGKGGERASRRKQGGIEEGVED